jgi:hypothetical protein
MMHDYLQADAFRYGSEIRRVAVFRCSRFDIGFPTVSGHVISPVITTQPSSSDDGDATESAAAERATATLPVQLLSVKLHVVAHDEAARTSARSANARALPGV